MTTENFRRIRDPRVLDVFVYAFVLLMGLFQFTHYPHTADFLSDVTYPDLARSLLQHGTYEVRLLPQTTLPPGLPFVLAAVEKFFGLAPVVAFRVIAAFTALGLIAAYEFLRRAEGRGVAAIACLLLGSSPALFAFNTGVVFPEMPYLFFSMVALLLALKIDRAERGSLVILWVSLLSGALVLAVLVRSVGVALLSGLFAWMLASVAFAPSSGRRRLVRFVLPLALGLAAQFAWSAWAHHHQTLEWQLPGYPESYVSQLGVKNGQYPELGLASARDIPPRIGRNVGMRAAGVSKLLVRRNIADFWPSPAVAGLIVLVVIGLVWSLSGGGQLYDWYFLSYEFIFLLWPWDYRDRFAFPVMPLICLYLWRGGIAVKHLLIERPRITTLALTGLGSILSISSLAFALRLAEFPVNPDHVRGDHAQTVIATLFWGAFAITALLMFRLQQKHGASLSHVFRPGLGLAFGSVGILAVAVLVGVGIKSIAANGRDNLHPNIAKVAFYPELEASDWIRSNEKSGTVVMAREPEFVFHYSHEPTVWFPPISDPSVLMDGIRRYRVGLIEVSHHQDSYWLPSEDACFEKLLEAYGSSFRLDHRGPDYWVYEVARDQSDASPNIEKKR